jgi:hypothetical protein
VEMSDGIYAEIDGEVIESGSGYFKGKISSGDRTTITSFAGMTLSTGIDGSIMRTTGSDYAKGNGEGNNFLRYYEVNNIGSMVTTDLQISFVSSGSFDERNSLADPYYIYRYSPNWNGYGEGASASPLSAPGIRILSGQTDWVISDGSFILFTDSEVASTGTTILFNESAEGGDGHDIEMTFSDLTRSGNVTVQQTNRAPSNLLNNKCLTYFWDISTEAGISSFTTKVSFTYLDSDLLNVTESQLTVAFYDDIMSKWTVLQDDTLDELNNIITVRNLDHFTTFAVGEPDAFVPTVLLDVKTYLEGPYSSTADSMRTDLRQPYNTAPWDYSGMESVSEIPQGVVDWILVELRSLPGASSKVASRAAFLKSDGSVVDLDGSSLMIVAHGMGKKDESRELASFLVDTRGGENLASTKSQVDESVKVGRVVNFPTAYRATNNSTSPVKFNAAEGNYYICIYHRNHLAVMSANPVPLSSGSSTLYDFTSDVSQYYGTDGAVEIKSGVWGMYGGDCNHDGNVTISDNNIVMNNRNQEGYKDGDINSDGNVTVADNNLVMSNRNKSTQVP